MFSYYKNNTIKYLYTYQSDQYNPFDYGLTILIYSNNKIKAIFTNITKDPTDYFYKKHYNIELPLYQNHKYYLMFFLIYQQGLKTKDL